MQFFIRYGKPVHSELRRIATALINQADNSLATSSIESGKAVHEARKSMKKLRALLRLTQSALNKDTYRAYDRAIHDFADTLSGVRDSKILTSSLKRLIDCFQPHVVASTAEPVIQRLQDVYNSEIAAFLEQRNKHHFEQQLDKLRTLLADWRFEKVT